MPFKSSVFLVYSTKSNILELPLLDGFGWQQLVSRSSSHHHHSLEHCLPHQSSHHSKSKTQVSYSKVFKKRLSYLYFSLSSNSSTSTVADTSNSSGSITDVTVKQTRAAMFLIPILGINFLLLPIRPEPGSSVENFYDIVSTVSTSFQGMYLFYSILLQFQDFSKIGTNDEKSTVSITPLINVLPAQSAPCHSMPFMTSERCNTIQVFMKGILIGIANALNWFK